MTETTSRTLLMQILSQELQRTMASEEEHGAVRLIGLGIQSIPPEAIELIRESVVRLSLQNNALSVLPQYFTRLANLRYLDIHENEFSVFPEILTRMPELEILDISFNSLTELPEEIGSLRKLKVLSLKNNRFERIPRTILSMTELKILELENNPFDGPTTTLLQRIPFKPQTLEWLQEIKTNLITTPIMTTEKPAMLPTVSQLGVRTLERSRSISESYVSSRAVKRMGFINVAKVEGDTHSNDEETPREQPREPPREMVREPLREPLRELREPMMHRSATDIPHRTVESMMNQKTTASGTASPINTDKLDSIPEHRSNDYFKRLSILPETRSSLTQLKMVEISRKILFAFSEFQATVRKMNAFCSEKAVVIEMVSQLYASRTMLDYLVDGLEKNSQGVVSMEEILKMVTQTVAAFKRMSETLAAHIQGYTRNTEVYFLRMLLLSVYMCQTEICNAFYVLSPEKKEQRQQLPPLRIPENGITQQQLSEYSEVDEQLYESLNTVLQSSSQVYSELNEAISKSAIANAKAVDQQLPGTAIQRIKELTGTCVTSMDLNKKLKIKIQGLKTLALAEKKKFYDEINAFLKSIITILASTKAIMNESAMLHAVRPSLASLTKATKDVTVMLEVSSYRMINDSFSVMAPIANPFEALDD